MKKIIILNKKKGETPLEALLSLRARNKKYKDVKMTYAGRLDPMASGLLLILAGEKVKEKERYLKLPKEYEFEVLFGFSTDTYDILGKITHSNILKNVRMSDHEKKIRSNLKYFKGKFYQTYPIYSSRTVKGRPLFSYARAGLNVELPKQKVVVKSLKFLGLRQINNKRLLFNIKKRINKVKGDFRQKEILKLWEKNLSKSPGSIFYIGSLQINCGSGTYVRGIANSLGKRTGTYALAYSIKRTKIGKWSIPGVK